MLSRRQCAPGLREAAFPLSQLFIASALIALVAGAIYWFGGTWGVVLLWGLGVLLLLPLAAAPIGLFLEGRKRGAAGYLLGAVVAGVAWLAAVGWCGWRAVLAIP